MLLTLARSDFWFPDGNVVLRCCPSSTGFKVHRGHLSRHSEAFSNILSIPQPPPDPNGDDLIDGVPFIDVYDDPFDMYYFLAAIYDGFYPPHPNPATFDSIASVLRLSRKYIAPHLSTLCLNILRYDFPPTLEGWDAREWQATDPPVNGATPISGYYAPRKLYAHPIRVIELALEMDVQELLPAAMYDLSRYGPSRIAEGAPIEVPLLPSYTESIVVDSSPWAVHPSSQPDPAQPLTPIQSPLRSCFSPDTSIGDGDGDISMSDLPGTPRIPSGSDKQENGREVQIKTLGVQLLYQTMKGRERCQKFLASFVLRYVYNRQPCADCVHLNLPSSYSPHSGTPSFNHTSSATPAHPGGSGFDSNAGYSSGPDARQVEPDNFEYPPSRPCLESFYFICLNMLRSVGGIACGRDADPLYSLLQAIDMLTRTDFTDGSAEGQDEGEPRKCGLKICRPCAEDFELACRRARHQIWHEIPYWFGLKEKEML